MNIISKILLTCTLCMGQLVYGQQEPVYQWGPPATNDFLERQIDQLLTLDGEGFVLLRSVTASTFVTTYWLEYYDTELKLVGNEKVIFNGGVMGDSQDIESIVVSKGKIYAFVSHWNKEVGEHTLALNELSLGGELTFLKDLDVISAKKMGNRGVFYPAFSDDGSKLLILSEQMFIKKTNEKLKMTCYDVLSMQELWSHDQELNWPSKRGVNNHIAVDNQGRAYMYKRMVEKMVYKYAMFTFDGKGDWKEYADLGLNEEELVDFRIEFNNNNEFVFLFFIQ